MHVLMVAAENDALPGLKVGGIGDVLRDLPAALAALECTVTVITPAYGLLEEWPQNRSLAVVDVKFRGVNHEVGLFEIRGVGTAPGVRLLALEHPAFSPCGKGVVYCDDPPERPFATDASKYALFAAAVGAAVQQGSCGDIDVLHLHDWHAALLLVLRRCHRAYRRLQKLRCVYTLHNLSLQGVRPLRGDRSALESWFPELRYETALVADPRWPDCINLMAVGIRLADAVHVVSPTYAVEILRPRADSSAAYHGGEGLEADLVAAHAERRLHGILNGCEYPRDLPARFDWNDLRELMRTENLRWAAREAQVIGAQFVAQVRLEELPAERPALLVTSVGRITAQKVRLLQEPTSDGRPALEGVLDAMGDDSLFVILGNGDPALEQFLAETSARRKNLLFLCGYSSALSAALYGSGDLFLMPSSFEPCGISQMLAMRSGQPCVVHQVGGLKDTVTPGATGFGFNGDTLLEQTDALIVTLREAVALREEHPRRWKKMQKAAADARFTWHASAKACLDLLYRPLPNPR